MLDRTSLTFPNDTSVMQQMCVTVTLMLTLATPYIFHGSNVNMIILDNDDFFIRLTLLIILFGSLLLQAIVLWLVFNTLCNCCF